MWPVDLFSFPYTNNTVWVRSELLAHVFLAVFEHSRDVVPAVFSHGSENTNRQSVVVDS
jgi:hypothetical protein